MRIAVTGAGGLLGQHALARLHARNCAARFGGALAPYDIAPMHRGDFASADMLAVRIAGADAILHFAGVNRASDAEISQTNPALAQVLIDACQKVSIKPAIAYANTVHQDGDSVYGRSKRQAADILRGSGFPFTDLILPHLFGEAARPFYNNVTGTLIDQIWSGQRPEINAEGKVELLYAGEAAELAINALSGTGGTIRPKGRAMAVPALYRRLRNFHSSYTADTFPDLSDDIDLELFNAYRFAGFPKSWPRPLKLNSDARGTLFEVAKGHSGGQTFVSWTKPGVTRGDHFHLNKVERFAVLQGRATIRVRRVLTDTIWTCEVTGETPVAVDMPTLHTHSLENTGTGPLLTLFWSNDLFDPAAPDTYRDPVLGHA